MIYMYEKHLIILRKFAVLSDSRSEPGSMHPQLLQHGTNVKSFRGSLTLILLMSLCRQTELPACCTGVKNFESSFIYPWRIVDPSYSSFKQST